MKRPSPYRRPLSILLAPPILIVLASTVMAQQMVFRLNLPLQSEKAVNPLPQEPPPATSDDKALDRPPPTSQMPLTPSFYTEKRFLRDLLGDQKAIWMGPLRMERHDARWLVPIAAATASLLATDRRASGALSDSDDLHDVSYDISRMGSAYVTYGTAGVLYLMGRATNNGRLKETGLLSIQALTHSFIVIGGLKAITRRERPDKGPGDGQFWAGGTSFPSGHAATTWALATVIAKEYRDRPLIRFGAYGFASAVSLSRVTGRRHFPSDVLVGATLGYLIGNYVVARHGTPITDRKSPTILPHVDPTTRTYGLSVTLTF